MWTRALLLTVLVVADGARAQYTGPGTEYTTCAHNERCVYWPYCHQGSLNTGGVGLIDPRTPLPIPANITDARPCESEGKLCCVDPDKDPNIDPGLQNPCLPTQICVLREQCIDGDINTSGIGILNPRVGGSCLVDGVDGVCCFPPVVPQCSRGRRCVTNEQCTSQGTINTDGSGIIDIRILDRCDLGGGQTGVCCLEPPPDVIPVEKCSSGATCTPTGYCKSEHLVLYNGNTQTCYRTADSGSLGECCLDPPVLTCPAAHTCNLPHQCVETPAILATKASCQLTDELIGVCCSKKSEPQVVVDVCPADSVCLPEVLCLANQQTSVSPTACHLSATGYSNPGVCCSNAIPDNTATPNAKCGEQSSIDTRIQNLLGTQAKFAEFPWMGIVFFRNQTFKCGATIVDDRWVATAAHCVDGFTPYDLRVRLGEYQVDLYDTLYPYEDYDLVSITVHPGFNSENLHNDVALLELDRPITYRTHINRICLPSSETTYREVTDCIATGWGKDAFDGGKFQVIMKKVSLPPVPHDECQHLLRKTRLGGFFKLDQSFVCAGGKAGQDACTGDGGGPLMCRTRKHGPYELYGITAWGVGCGEEGVPGVYVNVPYFTNWMSGIMYPQA